MSPPGPDKDFQNSPAESQDRTQLRAEDQPIEPVGEFAPGDLVGGDYQVISFIGAGGMGNVYRVRHTIMSTEYALKTLSAEKVTEVAWRRFQNEAQAIARMNHANVVAIYNLGLHEGHLPYYVMDLLKGKTLLDLLKERGRLETTEALSMFIEVCAGMAYAHKKGIVHRDIKPPNIVLVDKPDPSGARIKIVDFGIAKLSHTNSLANQQLTNAGEICGSPYYMSPEQCEAGKIDARSDIYSLGCTLFEALTGSPPFKGRNAMDTMLLHHTGTPPTLSAATGGLEFPELLEQAVAKMLAKAPMDRQQSMELVTQDLHKVLQGSMSSPIKTGHLPQSTSSTIEDGVPQPSKSGALAALAAVVAILLISAGVIYWYTGARQKPRNNNMAVNVKAAPAPEVAPPVKPGVQAPYSSTVSQADGKSYIVFNFPEKESLGTLSVIFEKGKVADCQGKVTMPSGKRLLFDPGAACMGHPEYLDRFRPDDLNTIEIETLDPAANLRDTFFEHMKNLTGLQGLSLNECDSIDDKAVDSIEQLPNLHSFDCKDSKISIGRLARSPLLGRLDSLTLSTKQEITPLLAAMKGSDRLGYLRLEDMQLKNSDYKLIGTFKNLMYLKVDRCTIHDQDLLCLSNLKHLQELEIPGKDITMQPEQITKKFLTGPHKKLNLVRTNIDYDRFKQISPTFELK